MDILCDYLFVEDRTKDNAITLHPIEIKFEGTPKSIRAQCLPRVEYAAELQIPHLTKQPKQQKEFIIVGTGPTLNGFVDKLRDLNNREDVIIGSVNRAHDYLIKMGIVPDIHILFERDIPNIEVSLGGEPHKDVTYYVCSTCDEYLFKQLKHHKIVLWHTEINGDEYNHVIHSKFPGEDQIGIGYSSSFLKLFGVGRTLGYDRYQLFGIDCSYPISGSSHMDGRGKDIEPRLYIWARNYLGELRKYSTNVTMMVQATDFIKYCKEDRNFTIKIHGDGLLGFVYGKTS